MAADRYTGSCNCGAVTAVFKDKPLVVRACWCRQCQKSAAGSATINALFDNRDFTMDGEVAWFTYVSDSGNTIDQGFCPACGTPVMGRNSGRTHASVIRLGFIDQPHDIRPTATIWLDEAPDWAAVDPDLEQVRRQPAPAPSKA